MIIKENEIEKRIEYLNLNQMKKFITENMKKIFDDILSNKNLKSIELENELKFENIKNQKISEYSIENKKSKLYVHKIENLYFILREIELNNYYEKNLLKEIKSLKDEKEIIKKINEFDFMIIQYQEVNFIILLHKDNDFKTR